LATANRDNAIVAIRNQHIDDYLRKRVVHENARKAVLRLMVPMQPYPQDIVTKIEELLEGLDTCFVELGYLDGGGHFDASTYRTMKIVRRIADKKIRSLEEIPEPLHEDFEHAFEPEAKQDDGHWMFDDLHRRTEVIQEQIDGCLEELEIYTGPATGLNAREGFDVYLAGLKKVPKPLELLIEHLNATWFRYKEAAAAAGNHYWAT
jgi:hypothetical protein